MNKILSLAINPTSIHLTFNETWTKFCDEEVEIIMYVTALIIIVFMMVIAFFTGGILIIFK